MTKEAKNLLGVRVTETAYQRLIKAAVERGAARGYPLAPTTLAGELLENAIEQIVD